MDEPHLRIDLLRLVCAALPANDSAAITQLDPRDPDTHIAAYAALVRTGTRLPDELHRLFYAQFAGCEPFSETASGRTQGRGEPSPRTVTSATSTVGALRHESQETSR